MDTQQRVRTFIAEELAGDTAQDLADDYPLIERRVNDLVGIFELVLFVERELGVEVRDDEVVPTNFGSIARIPAVVASKQGRDGGSG